MKLEDLTRIDQNRLTFANQHGPNPILFANADVPIESSAVSELAQFLEVGKTTEELARKAPGFFGDADKHCRRAMLSFESF